MARIVVAGSGAIGASRQEQISKESLSLDQAAAIGQISARFGQATMQVLRVAFLSALVLGLPTFLMGGTLPAVSRWAESSRAGMARLGFFYAGNIAGGHRTLLDRKYRHAQRFG